MQHNTIELAWKVGVKLIATKFPEVSYDVGRGQNK